MLNCGNHFIYPFKKVAIEEEFDTMVEECECAVVGCGDVVV